jgi:hypothetical protein
MVPELLNGIILLSPVEGWDSVMYSFSLLRPSRISSISSPPLLLGSSGKNRWQSLLKPLVNISDEHETKTAEESLSLLLTITSHAPTIEERVIIRREIRRAGLSEVLQVNMTMTELRGIYELKPVTTETSLLNTVYGGVEEVLRALDRRRSGR